MVEESLEKKVIDEPRIDPSTSPDTEHNLDARKQLGWCRRKDGRYYTSGGCVVADQYGQKY